MPDAQEVHTLICKRDLEMGRICLGSVLEASESPVRLVVHEDGSLDEADWDVLRQSLPNAVFVRRAEAEACVQEALGNRPHCRAYRERHVFSNKLLDIPILGFDLNGSSGPRPSLHYIDTDILFFRRCSGLFAPLDRPLLLQQDEEGYSGPLLSLLASSKRAMPSCCCAGMFRLPYSAYDLDYIEWFLSREDLWRDFPQLAEQTCYALLMGSQQTQVFSPRQMLCSQKPVHVDEDTVAVHFMFPLKDEFPAHVEPAARSRASKPPIELTLLSAMRLTKARVVARRLRRSIGALSPR